MLETIVLKLIGEAGLALVKRYWKPILFGVIGLTIAGTLAYYHWSNTSLRAKLATSEQSISAAVTANQSNIDTIRHMNRQAELDREAVKASHEHAAALQAQTDKAIEEIQRDPHASDPAGPFFDALGDGLRALDASRHPH